MSMQYENWAGIAIGLGGAGDHERAIRLGRLEIEAGNRLAGRLWFALRVWTGREISVKNSLVGIGIEACVPMRMGPEYRRRGRVIPSQPMPAIHGYVLARMPKDGSLLACLKAVEFFIDVVGGFKDPMPIPIEEVRRFMALADAGLYDWAHQSEHRFRGGDKATISAGVFWGMTCEIVSCRTDGCGDAVVMVSLLGKMVPMTVPLAILEKV